MLPKKNRLKKRKEFEEVFKEGKVFFGSFFLIRIKKNDFSLPRFAFVFPFKQEKSAVKRNKGKRLFREIVRHCLPSIKGGFDIILIIKKKSLTQDKKEIEEDVVKVFKKTKLIS